MKKKIPVRLWSEKGLQIATGTGCYPLSQLTDLRQLVAGSAGKFQNLPAFLLKNSQGSIIPYSYENLYHDMNALGTSLLDLGLVDEKIAIIGENRLEWAVSYLSVVNGAGIAVPLDKYLPENEIVNLITRSRASAIIFSSAYIDIMKKISESSGQIKYFICMDGTPANTPADERFVCYSDLLELGHTLVGNGNQEYFTRHIDPDALAVLLFTSGTTSMSKGVMLSHRNIASNVCSGSGIMACGPGDVHLSLLPLHHTFENTVGLLYMLHKGVAIAFCEGIRHIVQNLKEYRVTIFVAVPVIIESIYKKVMEGVRKSGKEKLLYRMMSFSDALLRCGIDVRKKLFRSVFAQFAPDLRVCVVGAAPMDTDVILGFQKIGLRVLQGYGLTETSPCIAATNDHFNEPGTVGVAVADVDVAILKPDENGIGEVIARGTNVMIGYYENPEATVEAIDSDGWFHTGDLGKMDSRGVLKITGRLKSMIVLGNGKKAFPEEFETLLVQIPGVQDAYVWGHPAPDGDIQICAKLVIDKSYTDSHTIDRSIRELNKHIPQYKAIRYFVLTDRELVKTTTLKVKRPQEHDVTLHQLAPFGGEMRKAHTHMV